MHELKLEANIRRGHSGPAARRVQEWLSLHGSHVKIDGEFGAATEEAVKQFQSTGALIPSGEVDIFTFEQLVAPMRAVLRPLKADRNTLADLTIAYAKQHLAQHPREIGGQNRGPWVRLYMDGRDGEQWPWCAGFACFCIRQACETLGVEPPITLSFSCDSLASSARHRGRFISEAEIAGRGGIRPGSLFLTRRTPTDWTHTGLVVSAGSETFRTIEGNTNDDGSREGYEVLKLVPDGHVRPALADLHIEDVELREVAVWVLVRGLSSALPVAVQVWHVYHVERSKQAPLPHPPIKKPPVESIEPGD